MEDGNNREEIYSDAVRAGKRTYFFDVKATKSNDLYLTITESKKRFSDDGKSFFEKHKIFLYKEDFEKFMDGLQNAVGKINALNESGEYVVTQQAPSANGSADKDYTSVNFEDLDK
jgi:hypothetical protein